MRPALILLVWVVAFAACGTRPPSFDAQRAEIEAAPAETAEARARRGWWRYLAGDGAGAEADFEANEHALAALGRARLALDALDHEAALVAAGLAAQAGRGVVREVAGRWARDAADAVRGGDVLLQEALGEAAAARRPLVDARWTLRASFLPHLDLRRLRQRPPALTAERVRALGKSWALSTRPPPPDPDGLVFTVWPLPAGPVHLEVELEGPLVAWRDGVPVAATGDDRFPARVHRFTAPGSGPLVLGWASAARPRAWRLAQPSALTRPAAGWGAAGRSAGDALVARALFVERALLDGDAETADRLLADAPVVTGFAAQRARLAGILPDLSDRAARDRALAEWTRAAELAPARAHLEIGRLRWRAGALDEAGEALREATRYAPDSMAALRALARVEIAAGHPEEADRLLARAARVAADPCTLLRDRAALDRGRGGERAERLIVDLVACGRLVDAAERLLELNRPEPALEHLGRAAPKSDRARRLRVRALVALDRLEEAAALAAEGDAVGDALQAADLSAEGDARQTLVVSERALAALVADHPTAREAIDLMVAWPQWAPMADLELATEGVIEAFEARPPLPGPAVRVLDHSALMFFADGRSLRWVHEILAIRSRDAAEIYGEVALPDDVRLVALYTRKADGRRIDGEETPEKESISLRDLEEGDYVVAQYFEPGDNGYLYDGGYLTPRVYFRGVELPIHLQRFEVYAPDDLRPAAQRLNGAPAPERVRHRERAGLLFEARDTSLQPPEPDAVPAGLWLPSVRVGQGVSLADDVDYLRDRLLARRARTRRFDAWAAQRAGDGTPRQKARRLARAVREAIDGEAGLIAEDAVASLASGEGNRGLVLSAALESVGVAHRLLLARPGIHVPAGPFLQVADFVYPLVELADGAWIDPGPDRAPIGFLPFDMLGGDALEVWPPTAGHAPVPLPVDRAVDDTRTVELTAEWGADGVLRGEVIDRLTGQEAIVIGAHLAGLEPEQRPRLVERLLVPALGAARVTELDDPTTDDPDGPLVLRYRFEAEVGERLRLGIFPVSPGRTWARLPTRDIPMAIRLPTRQRVRVRIESARDFEVTHRAGARAHGPHGFRLDVDADDDSLRAESTLVVAGGLITPAEYPDFAAWARAVDPAEQLVLERSAQAGARPDPVGDLAQRLR